MDEMPIPSDVKSVQQFPRLSQLLGKVNARPDMFGIDVMWQWQTSHDKAMQAIKRAVTRQPARRMARPEGRCRK